MKKVLWVIAGAGLFLASCAASPNDSATIQEVDPNKEYQNEIQDESISQFEEDAGIELEGEVTLLEEIDKSGIIFMREEEKLARDVYLRLADLWGMNIFSNIASSEDTHMEAVLSLIDMAGLEDPAKGLATGEFHNQDLQSLYNALIIQGGQSLAEALLVGAAVEEIDILDIQKFLAKTEDVHVGEVYQNLLNGSINHLNSFVRTYERLTDEEYQPQYLSEAAFQEMLTASAQGSGQGKRGVYQPRGQRQTQ